MRQDAVADRIQNLIDDVRRGVVSRFRLHWDVHDGVLHAECVFVDSKEQMQLKLEPEPKKEKR